METIAIEIVSQTASFRNPDFQNFHKSLELPPPTTIVGMVGAALGLSPLQAQEFFVDNTISFGIYGWNKGKCSDTWKYSKRSKDMWLYRTELDGSIIQKELLIQNKLVIIFFGENSKIESIKNAFYNPVYALTLGNSDSLAKIVQISDKVKLDEFNEVENTIVEGDVINKVMRISEKNMEFSIYHTSEPIAYDLPISFNYASDYGKRAVSGVKTFSFIGGKMKLNFSVKGFRYKNIFIPILNLQ